MPMTWKLSQNLSQTVTSRYWSTTWPRNRMDFHKSSPVNSLERFVREFRDCFLGHGGTGRPNQTRPRAATDSMDDARMVRAYARENATQRVIRQLLLPP